MAKGGLGCTEATEGSGKAFGFGGSDVGGKASQLTADRILVPPMGNAKLASIFMTYRHKAHRSSNWSLSS